MRTYPICGFSPRPLFRPFAKAKRALSSVERVFGAISRYLREKNYRMHFVKSVLEMQLIERAIFSQFSRFREIW